MDLKLSGLKYRQKELEEGRALQPALYASMMKKGGKGLPPSGFFVLEDGQLVTTEPQAFPGCHRRGGTRSRGHARGLGGGIRVLEEGARHGRPPGAARGPSPGRAR